MVAMIKHGRLAYLLRGLLMVVFGASALVLPAFTASLLLSAFGVLLLIAGLVTLLTGLRVVLVGNGGGLLIIEGAVMSAVGLFAALAPNMTAVAMIGVIGIWATVEGLIQLTTALRLKQETYDTGGTLLSALLSLGLGLLFIARPDVSVNAMVWLLGLFALATGSLSINLALQSADMRRRLVMFR